MQPNMSLNLTGNLSYGSNTEPPFLQPEEYYALASVVLALIVPSQLFLSTITVAGLCLKRSFWKVKLELNFMIGIVALGYASVLSGLLFGLAEYLFLDHRLLAGMGVCHVAAWVTYVTYSMRDVLSTFFCIIIF